MKTNEEIKKAASEYSGFNLWSQTNTSYDNYLAFIHGANFSNNEFSQFQQEWVDVKTHLINRLQCSKTENYMFNAGLQQAIILIMHHIPSPHKQ